MVVLIAELTVSCARHSLYNLLHCLIFLWWEFHEGQEDAIKTHVGYLEETYQQLLGLRRIAGVCKSSGIHEMLEALGKLTGRLDGLLQWGREAATPGDRETWVRKAREGELQDCVEICGSVKSIAEKLWSTSDYRCCDNHS